MDFISILLFWPFFFSPLFLSFSLVGMCLQGFKSCAGKPPGSHAAVLNLLSEKISGFSTKKGGVVGANGKENGEVDITGKASVFVPSGDAQVTFRR